VNLNINNKFFMVFRKLPVPACAILYLLFNTEHTVSQDFIIGEAAFYKLTYLSIPAVNISLSVPEKIIVEDRPVYHIIATAKTNTVFSAFYNVNNRYDILIDSASGLPITLRKKIHQKTLDHEMQIRYDQDDHRIRLEGGKYAAPFDTSLMEQAHNFFSMIYFLRRQPLVAGQIMKLNLDVETERWIVEMQVVGKETIEAADEIWLAHRVNFKFSPLQEEKKRRKTDILTRRLVTSKTQLSFWISAESPYPFLKVLFEMSPFNTYTILTERRQ
jgi:hypothetical protein